MSDDKPAPTSDAAKVPGDERTGDATERPKKLSLTDRLKKKLDRIRRDDPNIYPLY
jgi:hypothetical protein